MKRRDSLKTLVLGTVGTGLITTATGCETDNQVDKEQLDNQSEWPTYGRTPKELQHDQKLRDETFFNEAEMATLAVLCDLIVPADENSGAATEAGVLEFLEFIVKDIPEHQLPLRGGLMWLNHESNKRFDLAFKDATSDQQKAILDDIAFPMQEEAENLEMEPGIEFFNLIRNLTVTGFYTSKMGVIDDLGYAGNRPNIWDGVPEEVLKEHEVRYEPEWIAKCVDQSKRETAAEWDEAGNLLT